MSTTHCHQCGRRLCARYKCRDNGRGLAANKLGWEIVGIRDGFEGLLHPTCYPDGGLVTLSPQLIENLDPSAGGILGQASRVDPFHVRTVNEDDMVEEVDMSDELLEKTSGRKRSMH